MTLERDSQTSSTKQCTCSGPVVGAYSINGVHKERKKRAPTCSMVGCKLSLDSFALFFFC